MYLQRAQERRRNLPVSAHSNDNGSWSFFVNGYEYRVRSGAYYAGRKEVEDYDGEGFIQGNYPAPEGIRAALVSSLTDALGRCPHDDTARLVAHVWLVAALRHDEREEGFVPIPWQVLARDVPEAPIPELFLSGVLGILWESEGRCREYAAAPRIAAALDSALAAAPAEARYVNLFTGRPRRGRKPGSLKTDKNGNPISEPTAAAMDAIPQGILNLPSLEAHLDKLSAAIETAETEAERAEARARWRNDALCVSWIKSRGLTPTDVPGIYTYPHAWKAQKMGRLQSRQSGGPQNLTREGKQAMYGEIAELYNYDWRSSHPRILQDELRLAGLGCAWLDAYLDNPNAKDEYAERAFGSTVFVGEWKAGFCAAITGGDAGVPPSFALKPATRFAGGREITTYKPIAQAMRELESAVGREWARKLWPNLRSELEPLLKAVRAWHRWIGDEWIPANTTNGRGGAVVTNAVGSTLRLSECEPGALARKVAAFILQGREARLTHRLAALGDVYGYRVVSHEHDGLVTIGEIPAEAVERAKADAKMPFAELAEKEFV